MRLHVNGGLSIADSVLLACAVILTAIVVRRDVFGVAPHASEAAPPRAVPNWRPLISSGRFVEGDSNAPVQMIEFGDFECPYCAVFATEVLPRLDSMHRGEFALTFHHLPLSYHHFAYPAARAAECAARQGAFASTYATLYRLQDSLGLIPFDSLVRRGGVSDIPAFDSCNQVPGPLASIENDKKLAERLGVSGTPTLIINGEMYSTVPDSARIEAIFSQALHAAGRR